MSALDESWNAAIIGDFLKQQLQSGLAIVERGLGMTYAIHRLRQQPPGTDKTFITYELRVGYALPDQARLLQQMREGLPSPQVVPVEISLNEPICADQRVNIDANLPLRVST